LNFEQIFFYKKKITYHKIKVLLHECIKKFSKLILNFNFSKLIIFLYFDVHKIDTINQISTILKKVIFKVFQSPTMGGFWTDRNKLGGLKFS